MTEKNECVDHIYDTTGFCEWISPELGQVIQDFSKCNKCGNGKASMPKEMK